MAQNWHSKIIITVTIIKEKIMTDTIDTKITDLFGVLNKKKAEVESAEKTANQKWKTNCSFPSVFGNTQPINIQTQKEDALVELLSDLLIHDDFSRRSAALLGIEYNGGNWGGFAITDWVEDFKTRVAKLQLATKKADLAKLETRLNAIVSPEQRRAMELEAIMKSLAD